MFWLLLSVLAKMRWRIYQAHTAFKVLFSEDNTIIHFTIDFVKFAFPQTGAKIKKLPLRQRMILSRAEGALPQSLPTKKRQVRVGITWRHLAL
jgi:hypothetical protein